MSKLMLGLFAGAVVSAFCWLGNDMMGMVSVFPNVLTSAVMLVVVPAAIVAHVRMAQVTARSQLWSSALPIAAVAGLVLGVTTVVLGLIHHSRPLVLGMLYGAGIAFGVSMIVASLTVSLIWLVWLRRDRVQGQAQPGDAGVA